MNTNPSATLRTGVLYYGDNLDILRHHIPDESIDLIYLDPPFNSNRSYNVLFRESSGAASDAQLEAFEDTWQWGPSAERAYDEVVTGPHQKVARMLKAMVEGLTRNDVAAYLTMLGIRLIHLHRVLKPTGSIYLHCDPAAGHYLKVLMDAVFDPRNFRNEIVWKYQKYQKHDMTYFARNSDRLLWYAKDASSHYTFKPQFLDLDHPKRYLKRAWDKQTRRIVNVKDDKGHVVYITVDKQKVDDVWNITYLMPAARERLGYPTQKPLALLERIISASSNPGDIVLDPFCGCGTAVHAAHKLGRRWIGIDVTYLAIGLIRRRMRDAFPDIEIEEIGAPVDLAGAHALAAHDKYQFQWWALDRLGAQPVSGKKKGADRGIDGVIPFFAGPAEDYKRAIVSVKGGEHVTVAAVRDLKGVLEREKEPVGILLALASPTKEMVTEAAASGFYESDFWNRKFPRVQIITVEEMLAGKRADIPWGKAPFAKAPTEKERAQQETLL